MATTTFSGPIRTGKDPGYSDGRTIGVVALTQFAEVTNTMTSANSVFALPGNSAVQDFIIDVTSAFTGDGTIELGIPGNTTYFGSVGVSAAQRYAVVPGANGADWFQVSANDFRVTARVTGAPSAGAATVRINYEQKE